MPSFLPLLEVIPLGLAAGVTPTLLGLQLLVVSGPRWVRRSVAVAAANALAFSLVMALALTGFAQLPDAGTGVPGPISLVLRFGGGAALLALALWFFRPHPALAAKAQSAIETRTRNARLWIFFGLGFYFSITDVSSIIVMLPALHMVTVSSALLAAQLAAVLVLFALALLPTWLPPTLRALLGTRIEPTLDRFYSYVMTHQFPIVGAICAIGGVYLIVTGVVIVLG